MRLLAFFQDYQLCKGVCAGVYVCTGVCVYVCTGVCVYVCIGVCVYVCTGVCVYVCRGNHFRYSLGQLALQRCVCVGRVCVGAINSATVCVCRVVCV